MIPKTRTGKIARLPLAIRDRLNRYLADGIPDARLLPWLHSQVEVLEVLAADFGGRPISEQNLSEWRKGGFQDWLDLQEQRQRLRLLSEEAAELESAVEGGITNRLAILLAARYADLVAAMSASTDWSKPRNREKLRQLTEEITALRRLDHRAERRRLEREQLFGEEDPAHRERVISKWRAESLAEGGGPNAPPAHDSDRDEAPPAMAGQPVRDQTESN